MDKITKNLITAIQKNLRATHSSVVIAECETSEGASIQIELEKMRDVLVELLEKTRTLLEKDDETKRAAEFLTMLDGRLD